jgi:hypothetical protein
MTVQRILMVNDNPIVNNHFVDGFIEYTTCGMIESLKGTGPIKDLHLIIDGEKVSINLNGAVVPINEVVIKIIKSTTFGMLAPLKGVTNPIKKVDLIIRK